jgi:hypothetical protein
MQCADRQQSLPCKIQHPSRLWQMHTMTSAVVSRHCHYNHLTTRQRPLVHQSLYHRPPAAGASQPPGPHQALATGPFNCHVHSCSQQHSSLWPQLLSYPQLAGLRGIKCIRSSSKVDQLVQNTTHTPCSLPKQQAAWHANCAAQPIQPALTTTRHPQRRWLPQPPSTFTRTHHHLCRDL